MSETVCSITAKSWPWGSQTADKKNGWNNASLGSSYICFSVFEAFGKFRDSELASTNPAARKTENKLKCSTFRFVSSEVSLVNANSHLMVKLF